MEYTTDQVPYFCPTCGGWFTVTKGGFLKRQKRRGRPRKGKEVCRVEGHVLQLVLFGRAL